MDSVKIFSDGSSRGNPGPGGYGTILQFVDSQGNLHEKEISQGYNLTTNNRMELMGCIAGFEALSRKCRVEVFSDSKYLVDAFNEHWVDAWEKNNWKRPRAGKIKNPDLWQKLLKAMEGHEVTFTWVKGHDGHPENERCDRLATAAADSEILIKDQNFTRDDV